MTDAELRNEIVKLANDMRKYSEKTGQHINFIVEACATDFHPEFSERITELVNNVLGMDCYDEYVPEIFDPKFDEIMCRIGMELELEA